MRMVLAWVTGMGAAFLLAPAVYANGWNMPVGVTEISQDIYSLHMAIFWICVVIGVVVFAVMFYSLFRYRRSQGAKADNFHENTTVEVLWTTIPLLILVGMALPATATLQKMYDPSGADLDVMVTGQQWRWHYEYLDEDISFTSSMSTPGTQIRGEEERADEYLLDVDNPLVLPVDQKVRFLLTSDDVIHSWWVPDLAVKQDAIPGFVNENWVRIEEPGIYRGQCTELCGKDHAFMPVVVHAMEQDDYEEWLADRKEEAEAEANSVDREWEMDELMERGEQVYGSVCATCHQDDGSGSGEFPALAGNEEMLDDVDWHIDAVVNGVSGTPMAAFGGNLNAVELASVITYERNAWDNDTGDVVQPSEIQELLE